MIPLSLIYLYDIQTYTEITFNQQLATSQLPAGSHIRGKSSGATAFAVNAGASGLTVMFRQTSGTFAPGEQIEINGVDDLPVSNFQAGPRTIVSTRVFNSRDIMSVTQTGVSGFPNFTATTVLETTDLPDNVTGGVISGGNLFTPAGGSAPNLKVDDVLVYQAGSGDLRWNRITAVNSGGANFSLTATGSAVTGVYNPAVANGTYASVKLGISRIANEEKVDCMLNYLIITLLQLV